MTGEHRLRVLIDDEVRDFVVEDGANLRKTLLAYGISPYATIPDKLNCGGRGLCATCGVHIDSGEPAPTHWHDRIGAQFGYPRLSCQIRVEEDMTVRILADKLVWGKRDANRKWSAGSDER